MMLYKEFVPQMESGILKLIGFDDPCIGYIDNNNELVYFSTAEEENINSIFQYYPTSPLFQQAFRWLKKHHKIGHIINPHNGVVIYKLDKDGKRRNSIGMSMDPFDSYDDAEIASLRAILQMLKHLYSEDTSENTSKFFGY